MINLRFLKTSLSFALLLMCAKATAQTLTSSQLLEKAIAFHDPGQNWDRFSDRLLVTMETPDNPDRLSEIIINLPGDYFYLKTRRGDNSVAYTLEGENCELSFNDKTKFTEEEAKEHGVTCERATLFKNYYTYLYGLPMKLKDPGTIIDPEVRRTTFKGKEYLVLRVNYEEEVGSDVWQFYFDPETYAMEVYQFFKGEPDSEGKDTGEYILLSEMEEIGGIKMPKVRAWYYNKGDKYLGTDILKKQ